MGMSTHVVGFRPADGKWLKMKSIWQSCEDAGVKIPEEVSKFFDHESPGDKPGMEVNIEDAVSEWSDLDSDGHEIDVSKLPEGVSFIRAYNSC